MLWYSKTVSFQKSVTSLTLTNSFVTGEVVQLFFFTLLFISMGHKLSTELIKLFCIFKPHWSCIIHMGRKSSERILSKFFRFRTNNTDFDHKCGNSFPDFPDFLMCKCSCLSFWHKATAVCAFHVFVFFVSIGYQLHFGELSVWQF